MNIVWAVMILFSAVCAVVLGRGALVLDAAMQGADGAVTLVLSLCAMFALWSGIMKVVEAAGQQDVLSRLLLPVVSRLFPQASRSQQCRNAVTANLTANMLGLGNAATPAGLKAVGLMKELNGDSLVASDEMCMFLVVNMSSIQLLPASVISLRAAAGSANPVDILLPAFLATLVSTLFGVAAARLLAPLFPPKKPL
ncbi:MAG: spore maturation protein [Eubacteriales bacterium]|nr:spore maturation protein [Eubacteriales bacterium]